MLNSSLFNLSGLLKQARNRDQPDSVFREITISYIHKGIDSGH